MSATRPQMSELEYCPQCAGRLTEALDAAGCAGEPARALEADCVDGCGCCGCAQPCACVQPIGRSGMHGE